MLKRARPASPPPPFIPDVVALKRTRTSAPSFNNANTGHGYQSTSSLSKRRRDRSVEPEDMDEEEDSGSKRRRTVAPSLEGKARGWSDEEEEWKLKAGEYRDANTLLHELHEMNRHRLQPSTQQNEPPEESQKVKERYEERNKLLGSLFLSRRRTIHDTA